MCLLDHAGNKNDCTRLAHLLDHSRRKLGPLHSYQRLLADKGYDTATCVAKRAHGAVLS